MTEPTWRPLWTFSKKRVRISSGPPWGKFRGKVKNLKELRIGTIRVLFAFDPRSVAILLIGGDKAGAWSKWYDEAIAEVEVLYAQYLKELRLEGLIE